MYRYNIVITIILLLSTHCVQSNAQLRDSIFRYKQAYTEINDMLTGKAEPVLRRAVFLAEWAYLDGNLNEEKDFSQPIQQGVEFMKKFIVANNLQKYKTAKQIALCDYFFYPWSGNNRQAFEYDFSNTFPDEDWHHQLVSLVLKTHKGQCRSLPWTFELFAEALGADTYLAKTPRHCLIVYRDVDDLFPEDWVNVELTSHQYQPTFWIKEHGAISDSAISVGTYLKPLSKIECIANQLSDLGLGYYHKYGRYDAFTLQCAETSLKYYAMNPNAIIMRAKSIESLLQTHLKDNGGFADALTDVYDSMLRECSIALDSTHWTMETPELKERWEQKGNTNIKPIIIKK